MIPEERHINSAIIGYYRNGMANGWISIMMDIPTTQVERIIRLYLSTKNEIYVNRELSL